MKTMLKTIFIGISLSPFSYQLFANTYDFAPPSPQSSASVINVGIGPATLNNLGSKSLSYHLTANKEYEVLPSANLVLAGNFTVDERFSFLVSSGLGANYYFRTASITPFVGTSLGLGWTRSPEADIANVGGFTWGAKTGVQLFREKDVHLDISLNYEILIRKNKNGYPSTVSLTASFSFS